MPAHRQSHSSPYSTLQLFDLVADVERYPEFLPWVAVARVIKRTPEHMVAELRIRFAGISAAYTSDIALSRPADAHSPGAIDVRLIRGPFRHLSNRWAFTPIHGTPVEGGGCIVHFEVDFAFESAMFERIIGGLFEKAVRKMATAFEERARQLYG